MILLGAPGAGKGTHGEKISNRFSIPIIGTGKIIRDAIKSGSETGRQFKAYTESGGLIPDEAVVKLVAERLAQPDCRESFILDGFPRTVRQAQLLEEMSVGLDAVIYLEITDEEIIDRIAGRRVCKDCGAPFHVKHNPPKTEGVCDSCKGELGLRADDAPETVKNRLRVYHEQTEPLIGFYRERGKVLTVNSAQPVETVEKDILSALRLSYNGNP